MDAGSKSENILEIKNLNVSYGDKKILNNISLNIKKNTITSIVGPSGCGKSTLLKSINAMLKEEEDAKVEGDILFNGININNMDLDEVRKNIGIVFQSPAPFPLSIIKNMTYALKYHGIKDKNTLEKKVMDTLEICGLYDEVKSDLNKSALRLSGGQQQRLCIARALTINPKVLLLDEPCSALDVKNTEKIENLLMRLSSEYTIVIVTHNLSQAKKISEYCAFMMEGEIIEYGEDIFSNPLDNRTLEYLRGC